jgi:hypothetical protein
MTTDYTAEIDQLLDEAMTPPPPPSLEKTYFGQVVITDAYACVLQKGAGKVLFDPTFHAADQKRIAVKLGVQCIARDGSTYTVDQDVITSSKEWRDYTLPSLQRIQRDVRSLRDAYVQVTRKPTGEKYQHKTSGEMRDKTALVFDAVFADADAQQAAADVFYKRTPATDDPAIADAAAGIRKTPEPVPFVNPPAAKPAADAPPVDRTAAAQFLPIIWQMANQDKEAFFKAVCAQPNLAPFHQPNAPEMVAYLGENWLPF